MYALSSEMVQVSIDPMPKHYTRIISCAVDAGELHSATKYVTEMIDFGYKPMESVFNRLATECARQSRLSDIIVLLDKAEVFVGSA